MPTWPTTSGPTSRPSSSTTAMVQPGNGSPMEPPWTSIFTALKLPMGRPTSLAPYWSITVTPQCCWKKVTTSAFRGSPQLLAHRTRTG